MWQSFLHYMHYLSIFSIYGKTVKQIQISLIIPQAPGDQFISNKSSNTRIIFDQRSNQVLFRTFMFVWPDVIDLPGVGFFQRFQSDSLGNFQVDIESVVLGHVEKVSAIWVGIIIALGFHDFLYRGLHFLGNTADRIAFRKIHQSQNFLQFLVGFLESSNEYNFVSLEEDFTNNMTIVFCYQATHGCQEGSIFLPITIQTVNFHYVESWIFLEPLNVGIDGVKAGNMFWPIALVEITQFR